MKLLIHLLLCQSVSSFIVPPSSRIHINARGLFATPATVAEDGTKVAETSGLLESMSNLEAASSWSEMFGLGDDEKTFYALFEGIRKEIPFGLGGKPFVLKKAEIEKSISRSFDKFFTYEDLKKAVEEDFLDAGRGSTDNRRGWKMTSISTPRGQSFEEARMRFEDVEAGLEQGTVIFNSAGAHIPKLAGAALACSDATSLPCALNTYVTNPGKRTSAPPHTDKQDVVVVQTSGSKYWKVYSPPDPARKPMADPFARGKGDDNLPLYALESDDFGCELLLETTLNEGDVLFIPAAFPHTTTTSEEGLDQVSIHLTFGIDTHIWGLDYLSVRRLALKRSQVTDSKLGQNEITDNHYTGSVNELSNEIRSKALKELPFEFLDDEVDPTLIDKVSADVERIAKEIDETVANKVDSAVWKDSVIRTQEHGKALLDIHRDMYLAAIEEGATRVEEQKTTGHVDEKQKALTPEQMQRLSVFRVKRFFDKISVVNKELMDWCSPIASSSSPTTLLPDNWQFTLPANVGDEVEADLGGAFFPARVTKVVGNKYDVQFFDGDKEDGLDRDMIKLMKPPVADEEAGLGNMTPKELRRWKKKQEKKKGNK